MTLTADLDTLTMQSRAEEAARLLRTLGNPQRLRVLCLLVEGECSVGQLHARLPGLSQSALSQHLARLRADKLVHTRRESQTVLYSLRGGPAEPVMQALHAIYCGGGNP